MSLAALTLACGGRGGEAPQPPAAIAAPDTVVGSVRVAGATPMEQVLIERGEADAALQVSGAYREELIRLSGATVRASGAISDRSLRVTDYEIVEIAGRKPIVGILDQAGEGMTLRTASGEVVRLSSVPDELREQAGAKVWLILDAEASVKGYGILRDR